MDCFLLWQLLNVLVVELALTFSKCIYLGRAETHRTCFPFAHISPLILSFRAILSRIRYPIRSSMVSAVSGVIPLFIIRDILSSIRAQIASSLFSLLKTCIGVSALSPYFVFFSRRRSRIISHSFAIFVEVFM